jgi:hypothetical protein
MLRALLRCLGLVPSARDLEIKHLVENSYKSVRVVGRGTIKIDAAEVRSTPEFLHAIDRAAEIVRASS